MKPFIALLNLCFLSACATLFWAGPPEPLEVCQITQPGTLKVSGSVNDGMLSCVEANLTPSIDTIVLNSWGGDVKAGRAIGRLIGARPRTLIIDGECLSSCGNYFVPAVNKLVMRPGAIIGLHGSLDPMFFAKVESERETAWAKAQKTGKMSLAEIEQARLAFRQMRDASLSDADTFAAMFNIPLGWRMYRLAGAQQTDFLVHFDGEMQTLQSQKQRIMLVTGPMLASCLPDVQIDNYQDHLEATVFSDEKRMRELAALKMWSSGSLTCKPSNGPVPFQ